MGHFGDSWKLVIFPLAFLFILSSFLFYVINPFIDTQAVPVIDNPFTSSLELLIQTGSPFNLTLDLGLFSIDLNFFNNYVYNLLMPDFIQDYLLEQVYYMYYLPYPMQSIIGILVYLSLILGTLGVVLSFIP